MPQVRTAVRTAAVLSQSGRPLRPVDRGVHVGDVPARREDGDRPRGGPYVRVAPGGGTEPARAKLGGYNIVDDSGGGVVRGDGRLRVRRAVGGQRQKRAVQPLLVDVFMGVEGGNEVGLFKGGGILPALDQPDDAPFQRAGRGESIRYAAAQVPGQLGNGVLPDGLSAERIGENAVFSRGIGVEVPPGLFGDGGRGRVAGEGFGAGRDGRKQEQRAGGKGREPSLQAAVPLSLSGS